MPRTSAGILMYRRGRTGIEVLLVHPGGPFWAKKDAGAWSIPKGEYDAGDDPSEAARREFQEELGVATTGGLTPLGEVKQKAGKVVTAFALEGDIDVSTIRSNPVEIEWPPRSGRQLEIPEIDRAGWFNLVEAKEKILPSQAPLLERLAEVFS